MGCEKNVLGSPIQEVPVVEGEVILAIRALADCGVGSKAIARAVGVARNTVRRYLRRCPEDEDHGRPTARRLTEERRLEARCFSEREGETQTEEGEGKLTLGFGAGLGRER